MKKIFILSASFLLAIFVLNSCVKERVVVANNDNYWFSKEQGEIVYSDSYCNYFVVATYNGYNIVRTYAGSQPYEGDIVYGNFSNTGTRDMYNSSGRFVFTGAVVEYWLSYNQALDALDYYCPIYGKGIEKRTFKESIKVNKK